jgi:hypothetical protein
MTDFVDDLERELLGAARRRTARRRRRLPRLAPRPILILAALAAAIGVVSLIARPASDPERPVARPTAVPPPPAELRTTDVLVLNETETAGVAAVARDELAAKLGIRSMVDTGPVHGRKQTVVQAIGAVDITLARTVADALDARFDPGPLKHTIDATIPGRDPRVVVFVGSDRMR